MRVDDVGVCTHLGLSSVTASFILRSSHNPYLLPHLLSIILTKCCLGSAARNQPY